MNFDVVKQAVAYGRGLQKEHGKVFRFTLTTNAYHVTDEMADFLNREMKNVVISIDGRKEVHDKMRRNAAGGETYDREGQNAKKIVDGRGGKEYYIRGTFTRENLDFGGDVIAIAEAGFDQISLEPVVTNKEYAIREEDLPQLKHEYEMLARDYTKRRKNGKGYNFFHFVVDLNSGPCLNKRLRGCVQLVRHDGGGKPRRFHVLQHIQNTSVRRSVVFHPHGVDFLIPWQQALRLLVCRAAGHTAFQHVHRPVAERVAHGFHIARGKG